MYPWFIGYYRNLFTLAKHVSLKLSENFVLISSNKHQPLNQIVLRRYTTVENSVQRVNCHRHEGESPKPPFILAFPQPKFDNNASHLERATQMAHQATSKHRRTHFIFKTHLRIYIFTCHPRGRFVALLTQFENRACFKHFVCKRAQIMTLWGQ